MIDMAQTVTLLGSLAARAISSPSFAGQFCHYAASHFNGSNLARDSVPTYLWGKMADVEHVSSRGADTPISWREQARGRTWPATEKLASVKLAEV